MVETAILKKINLDTLFNPNNSSQDLEINLKFHILIQKTQISQSNHEQQ